MITLPPLKFPEIPATIDVLDRDYEYVQSQISVGDCLLSPEAWDLLPVDHGISFRSQFQLEIWQGPFGFMERPDPKLDPILLEFADISQAEKSQLLACLEVDPSMSLYQEFLRISDEREECLRKTLLVAAGHLAPINQEGSFLDFTGAPTGPEHLRNILGELPVGSGLSRLDPPNHCSFFVPVEMPSLGRAVPGSLPVYQALIKECNTPELEALEKLPVWHRIQKENEVWQDHRMEVQGESIKELEHLRVKIEHLLSEGRSL